MNTPFVSVVIPFVDEFDFLGEAIASALAQEDIRMEIIVVCNKTDIPADYASGIQHFDRIRWAHQPVTGSAHARNLGLDMSLGEWIQFFDVDDLLLPAKIKNQLVFQEADVIVSPHQFQQLNGHRVNSKWIENDVWSGLLNSGLGSTSSWLWKKSSLVKAGAWNPAFQSHQEYELLFRMLQAGFSIKPLMRYDTIVRQRKAGSITLNSKPVRAIEGVNLREMMWNYVIQHGLETEQRKNAFQQYLFRQLRGLYKLNPGETMDMYRMHFSKDQFTPEEAPSGMYKSLYKLLGFRWTENIVMAYTLLRDKFFPFLPVNR